jgi:hypothetical protein
MLWHPAARGFMRASSGSSLASMPARRVLRPNRPMNRDNEVAGIGIRAAGREGSIRRAVRVTVSNWAGAFASADAENPFSERDARPGDQTGLEV